MTKAAFKQLQTEFPTQNLKKNFVVKQLKWFREEREKGVPTASLKWSRKRSECGRGVIKFSTAVAKKLIEINNRHWGALSFKRLAGKLSEEGISVTEKTVRKWCKELGMIKRRRYIKPKLTLTHRINRLSFVLGKLTRSKKKFSNLQNVVHSDEKWFFLMRDGEVCRVFPDENGEYKMPASPKVYHKSRMPKVMVLAVCARPRPEYGFDGRIGLWSFTLERPAKRSNVRTGTVVGQTMVLEDVRVDSVAYRDKVIKKGGVFEAMRQKMWWFHRDARYKLQNGKRVPCGDYVGAKWHFAKRGGTRCPEAGTALEYQHDGARPHTSKENTRAFACHSKMRGFKIEVVVQPAQSPDLNVDDLAFFRSLQSDVSLVAKETRRDLLEAVHQCWEEYPAEKMESVWRCLFASYHGVLESGGGNEYQRHRGSRAAGDDSDAVDRAVSSDVLKKAQDALAELERQRDDPESSAPNTSDDSSPEDTD